MVFAQRGGHLIPAGVEGGHALVFEGLHDVVVVDAHGGEIIQHPAGVLVGAGDAVVGDLAMVGHGVKRCLWHGVDHAGGDQVGDVAGVGVGGVFDPGGGP